MRNKIVISFAIIAIGTLAIVPLGVTAQSAGQREQSPRSAYEYMKQISAPETLVVPTVLEMPVTNAELQQWPFALFDTSSQRFVRVAQRSVSQPLPARITEGTTPLSNLVDNRADTYVDFEADSDEKTIILSYDAGTLISSSQLKIDLDQYSKAPSSVSLYTNEGSAVLISTDTKLSQGSTYFPLTGAQHWEIRITHSQPLRISGISIVPAYSSQSQSYSVRFLAVPGHMYYLYMSPNGGLLEPSVEYVDLETNAGVMVIPPSPTVNNPEYIRGDQDNDSIPDDVDNCQTVANPDQLDTNKDGKGDSCEDFDRDMVMNTADNCPNASNINQQDADGDGYGDVCDPEESRITERYWWLPWLGILVGFAVVASIFATTAKGDHKR